MMISDISPKIYLLYKWFFFQTQTQRRVTPPQGERRQGMVCSGKSFPELLVKISTGLITNYSGSMITTLRDANMEPENPPLGKGETSTKQLFLGSCMEVENGSLQY